MNIDSTEIISGIAVWPRGNAEIEVLSAATGETVLFEEVETVTLEVLDRWLSVLHPSLRI